MFKVGFVTGCFDLTHESHFEHLKRLKTFCKTLIVGLTTDARCEVEKRKPILSYRHRATILKHCRWVDVVVENRGCPKYKDWTKYHFDVLFTSDEYLNSKEMNDFRAKCPDVRIYYFPRIEGVSTTELVEDLRYRFQVEPLQLFEMSLHGPVLQMGNTIIKPIHVGFSECANTQNVYGFAFPNLPRNWKVRGSHTVFPNISGVNSNRELSILAHIRNQPWNPIQRIRRVFVNSHVSRPVQPMRNYGHIQEERRYPKEIHWIYMKNVQPTLHQWVLEHEQDQGFVDAFQDIVNCVKSMTESLNTLGGRAWRRAHQKHRVAQGTSLFN